ncbi:hypothetical protein GCM10022222_01550 [Amycolatopsis ultiminotia]|uniref:SpoVT-AbrB domain-containing protein n=1 Tax=Amycolatopsis ultiminotia TaxID=543629 RepID=A0ABP6UZC2_9PSEU
MVWRVARGLAAVTGGVGPGVVLRRGRLVVPVGVRRRCRIVGGAQVLLVALTEEGVLVVYPQDRLAEMVGGFHTRLVAAGSGIG